MITTKKKIEIFDDTGRGDSFEVEKVLYEDEEIILCTVINEWYEKPFIVLIYKKDGVVSSRDLRFYLAKNC